MPTYPIVALADGEVLDPGWIEDITDAANELHDDVTDLTLLTTAQSVSSFTTSSNIGTSVTAVLTLTGCVLGAGRAYSVENIGGVYSDASGRLADFSLWKTSTSGTQIGALYRTRCEGAPQMNCYGKVYLRNSGTSPLTFDLVLAVVASAGTVTHDASALVGNRPRALVVTDVGPASAWTFAFAVT
jgi:hypothetical protein